MVVDFPGYAPELNPDEMVWGWTKYGRLCNYAAADLTVLRERVEAELEYLIPGDKGGYGAGPAATARLAIVNWYLVTLYPKGRPVRESQTLVASRHRFPSRFPCRPDQFL